MFTLPNLNTRGVRRIGHFRNSNIHLDSEPLSTKTIEKLWNECENINISSTFLCLCPFVSSKPRFQAEF